MIYNSKSNLLNVLRYNKRTLKSELIGKYNLIDIDLEFIKQAYNLNSIYKANNFVITNNFTNIFLHPKQLYNLFNNIELHLIDNKINVKYNDNIYLLPEFINIIEKYDLSKIIDLTIKEINNRSFQSNKLLLIVFIGNKDIGKTIIDKVKKYKEIQDFSILFCIRDTIINNFIDIHLLFPNSIIYTCSEFGNDIVPSLLTYYQIKKLDYKFDYIIKIHSKSNDDFEVLINFLLNKNLDELLINKIDNCNTISDKSCYNNTKKDICNINLYKKYNNLIKHSVYSRGTIFLIEEKIYNKVLDFLIYNYKSIVFNNMYDDNSINKNNSYVHFLERLFGLINI